MKRIVVAFRVVLLSFCAMVIALCGLHALDGHGLLPPVLGGISYLPPLWLFLALFVLAVALVLVHAHRAAMAALLSGLCFLILYGDHSLHLRGIPMEAVAEDQRTLRVLTLNVRYYSEGVARVGSALGEAKADIILLCEHRLPDDSVGALMAHLPGYRLCQGREDECALLSRFPVRRVLEVELPSRQASLHGANEIAVVETNPHRSFMHAEIEVDKTIVHALSVRFIAGRAKDQSLREQVRWGRYLEMMQRAEVYRFREYLRGLDGPVVFGGDLNAPPSSRPIRLLCAEAVDTYRACHVAGGATFRTDLPLMRLDYVFCSEECFPLSSRVLPDRVSDHFPLLSEVAIPSSFSPVLPRR